MKAALLVFVKAPRPGGVKTRLAGALGPELAARLYRAMAERVVQRTAGEDDARVFFYSPADAGAEVEAWLGGLAVPQARGDLGARMAAAFQWAFDRGAARAVLVGTDVPDLAREDVRAAFTALRTHDLALGPSLDGGYYLIGLRQSAPRLFGEMPWSTPDVLGETLRRADEEGMRVRPLPVRGDVDTIDDLRRDWKRLRAWLPVDLAREIAAALQG
jgi:rSAM/selenodomain-associated transferase 1